MSNLYDLSAQMQDLINLSDDDEMQQAIEDTLELMSEDFDNKVFDIIKLIKNKQSDIVGIDTEITRLSDRKAIIKSGINSVINYIKSNMEKAGKNKLSNELFNLTLAKGRDVLIIDDEDLIPDEFVNVQTIIKPMKKELLAAAKNKDIAGVHVEKSAKSLRIK